MNQKKASEINTKILDELEFGFSCEKREHRGWIEGEKLKKLKEMNPIPEELLKEHKIKEFNLPDLPPLFGRWQYVFRSTKGEISLIRLNKSLSFADYRERWVWQIWDRTQPFTTQDFNTKKEAIAKIKELLC